MSFQISPELDAKKVFLVRSSELEGRLDPNFYSIISKTADNFICIKKIAKVKGGKRIPKGKSFSLSDTKFRYMRVEDIANNKLVVTSLKCISKELFEFLERYEVKGNDLVISIAGTAGRTIIVNNDTDNRIILTENAAKIVLLSNKLTVDALNIILQTDLVQNQIKALYIQTTIPKLGLDKILNLKIHIPSVEVQSAIVAKMDAAYSSKREKEAEAQRLLDSIDVYLLGELGIELPEQEKNTVQSRIFTRRFSEISGGRLDPDFHSPFYKKYEYLLYKSPFDIKKLSEISVRIFQGVGRKLTDNDKCTLLKVKNILKNNDIDFHNIEFVDIEDKDKLLNTGDIISPFIGEAIKQYKFSVYGNNGNYTVDNNTGVIRLKADIANPVFVSAVIMSSVGKWQLNQSTGGGGVPFLGSFYAKRLKIPLPPLSLQIEIADHITLIRSRAKQLQQEAKDGLEQAKREVEAVLLGDA